MRRAGWLVLLSVAAGCNDPSPMDLQPLPAFKKVPPRPDPRAVSTPPEHRGPPELVPTDEVLDGGGAAAAAMAVPSVVDKLPQPLTEANLLSWAKLVEEFASSPPVAKLGAGNGYALGQEPHMVLLSAPYQEAWKKAQQRSGLDDDQVLRLNSLVSIFVMQMAVNKPSKYVVAAESKDKSVAAAQAQAGLVDDAATPRFATLRSAFGDVAVDAVLKHQDRLRAAEMKRGAYQAWARAQSVQPMVPVNVRGAAGSLPFNANVPAWAIKPPATAPVPKGKK